MPKYPHITVQLSDQDGNAFAIIGRVRAAMKRARVPVVDQDAFMKEVTAGDYDHVLQTVMAWVDVV